LWEDEGKNNGQRRRVELGMRHRKLANRAKGGVYIFVVL
jgi:hypothetical protein